MYGSSQVTDHGINGTYSKKGDDLPNGTDPPQGQPTPVDDVASSKKVLVCESENEHLEDVEQQGCCLKCCAPEGRPGFVVLRLLACVIAGAIFGWCLEKGRGECIAE